MGRVLIDYARILQPSRKTSNEDTSGLWIMLPHVEVQIGVTTHPMTANLRKHMKHRRVSHE
jgi:hypothetical protein